MTAPEPDDRPADERSSDEGPPDEAEDLPASDDEQAPGDDLARGGWGSVEPNEPA